MGGLCTLRYNPGMGGSREPLSPVSPVNEALGSLFRLFLTVRRLSGASYASLLTVKRLSGASYASHARL